MRQFVRLKLCALLWREPPGHTQRMPPPRPPFSPRSLALLCLAGAASVGGAASALGLPVYSTLLAAALVLLRVLDYLPCRAPGKATSFASSREALENRADAAVPDAIRLAEHLSYTRERAAKAGDTLLVQRSEDAVDRLRTAKERVPCQSCCLG